MNNSLFILMLFWGVWIIIPVVFDGLTTFIYMVTILYHRPRQKACRLMKEDKLPLVSVIIPAYNEEDNISQCLYFLKQQSYPQELLEIIVVDNGSTDFTNLIVRGHMSENADSGNNIQLITRTDRGKARALNNGIAHSKGEIVINIDCRSYLDKNAIYYMVAHFLRNPEYGALTGNVEIEWRYIFQRDSNGLLILDKDSRPISSHLSRKEKFLAKSQFMEYLTSFYLGRQFQDITESFYTLSGAFSAFRREALEKTHLYQKRTVSEDTDLTLDLMGEDVRIGFCEKAKAYLKPVISFEKFYAQRVRWGRGQIEVVGVHFDWYANLRKNFKREFLHGAQLIIDHTFGFPRLLWTFLLPIFFLFGYSMSLILTAIVLMWAFYVIIDLMNAWFCWRVVSGYTRKKISNNLHYAIVTPIFRLIAFYFRFASYLEVLTEPQAWTSPISPVKSAKRLRKTVKKEYRKTARIYSCLWRLMGGNTHKPMYEEKIAELDSFGLENNSDSFTNQKG